MRRRVGSSGPSLPRETAAEPNERESPAPACAGAVLQEHLDALPPGSTSPIIPVGALGGLAVTAQVTTMIDDEIRVLIADAKVEQRYTLGEWQAADPAMIVTRLERQLQRLPDVLASTQTEVAAAAAEAASAQERIGQPWDHAEQLSSLRRRQQEIDERLAATVEPDRSTEVDIDLTVVDQPLDAAIEAARQRLDALELRDGARSAGLSL